MNQENIASDLARGFLENRLTGGTIRAAKDDELIAAKCFLKVVTNLEELEDQLRNNPEESVLLECNDSWATIQKIIRQSGTSNCCRILVNHTV